MNKFLTSVVISLALAAPLAAQEAAKMPADKGLSQPVIALTGVLAKNMDALELTEEQRAAVKAWVDEKPAKRMAFEDEVVALRTELRAKIAAGAPAEERKELAEKIGAMETELLLMRSGCADHWRETLDEAQFAKLLELAGVTE